MEFKDLTPEQKSKVRSASSAEELLELAKAEGIELSADELEKTSGGGEWNTVRCSTCAMEYDYMKHSSCPRCGELFIGFARLDLFLQLGRQFIKLHGALL